MPRTQTLKDYKRLREASKRRAWEFSALNTALPVLSAASITASSAPATVSPADLTVLQPSADSRPNVTTTRLIAGSGRATRPPRRAATLPTPPAPVPITTKPSRLGLLEGERRATRELGIARPARPLEREGSQLWRRRAAAAAMLLTADGSRILAAGRTGVRRVVDELAQERAARDWEMVDDFNDA